jgi:hypothetical protein
MVTILTPAFGVSGRSYTRTLEVPGVPAGVSEVMGVDEETVAPWVSPVSRDGWFMDTDSFVLLVFFKTYWYDFIFLRFFLL